MEDDIGGYYERAILAGDYAKMMSVTKDGCINVMSTCSEVIMGATREAKESALKVCVSPDKFAELDKREMLGILRSFTRALMTVEKTGVTLAIASGGKVRKEKL